MKFSSLAKLLLAFSLFLPVAGCGGDGGGSDEIKKEEKQESAKESAKYGETSRYGPGGQDKPAPKEDSKNK